MKNGEVTKIYMGDGVTQIYPASPDKMCPVLIAGQDVLDAEVEEIDQGPLTDIWASIARELRRENRIRTKRQREIRKKIRRSIVPILALIALFLLAITPDSYDMLPAGTRQTMLIIVVIVAAAYLVLIWMANFRGGTNDPGRSTKKYGYIPKAAQNSRRAP